MVVGLLDSKSKVLNEMKQLNLTRIRDLCHSIDIEIEGMRRNPAATGWSSGYITEKVERIRWRCDDLDRLNKLLAKMTR